MQRYRLLKSAISFCLCCFISSHIQAAEKAEIINIGTWGGVYEAAQKTAIFSPFETQTGIKLKTTLQYGGLAILQGSDVPDIVDMEEPDARLACEKGLLHSLDFIQLLSTDSASAIESEFLEDSFSPCAVAHNTFSTVVAYSSSAFSGEKPQTIVDFFDVERFPGMRGLQKKPSAILEWALLAYGIPISQIYDLLSTARGMKLAFRKIEKLRGHIIWWQDPDEPAALLGDGTLVMSSGYNGRFFDAQSPDNPIIILWDGQIVDRSVWAFPAAHTEIKPAAKDFIGFAMNSKQQAKLADIIPYGPTRLNALKKMGNHPTKGIPMVNHLPLAKHHLKRAIFRDTTWYSSTAQLRQQAFDAWLKQSSH
jgi:putative spermidine/putrescine transport system substrate-binding protein